MKMLAAKTLAEWHVELLANHGMYYELYRTGFQE